MEKGIPEMLAKIMDGLVFFNTSYPSPNLSSFPGINFSTLLKVIKIRTANLERLKKTTKNLHHVGLAGQFKDNLSTLFTL